MNLDAVLAALDRSPHVRLCGITAYEGLLPDIEGQRDDEIRDLLAMVVRLIDDLVAAGRLPPAFIVTAGGSAAFDLVVEALSNRWPGRAEVILRSGCYITHDHGIYAATSPLVVRYGRRSNCGRTPNRDPKRPWLTQRSVGATHPTTPCSRKRSRASRAASDGGSR
jgi:hypothetical protein